MAEYPPAASAALRWIDRHTRQGPVAQLGEDQLIRERQDAAVLRVRILAPACEGYPEAARQALESLHIAWGAPLEVVLDFDHDIGPNAATAMTLLGMVDSQAIGRLVVIRKPWMRRAMTRSLRTTTRLAGLPFALVDEQELEAQLQSTDQTALDRRRPGAFARLLGALWRRLQVR